MSNSVILFIAFLSCLFLGVPVAIALGIASMVYLFFADVNITIMANQFFSGMNSFVLVCIPGFLLAGAIMNNGGITEKIVTFSKSWLGHIRGGIAQSNIACCTLFAGISGSAVAEAASIGSVMIPAMKKSGYDGAFAAGLTASSSLVGPIIPPSVPMIIVGSLSGLSVGKMFVGGIIPGVLMAGGMMIIAYTISVLRKYPCGEKASWKQRFYALIDAFWAIMTPVIIIAGFRSGKFTPTEAAIITVVYGLFVCAIIYRSLSWKSFFQCARESASGTANIVMLVGFANVFAWILTSEGIPQIIADAILAITDNKFLMILLINGFLLVVGMFMETIAAILILYSPLSIVAAHIGMDPVQFAIMMIINLVLGLTTPPVGVCLYVTQAIAKVSLLQVSYATLPFLFSNLVVLALVSYVPAITLWLPSVLM